MAKILNVRLPDASTSQNYDPQKFNQLVRSLEQVILQLNSTYISNVADDISAARTYYESGGQGRPLDGTESFFLPYGAFIDRTTQTATTIDTAYALSLEVQQLSNGVYRDAINTSRVYVDVSGVYNVQFSAQLQKTSGGAATAFIWFRVNGQDVGASATKITVQGSSAAAVPAWNFLLDLNAGDYFELMWAVTNTGLILLAEAATAFCPSIPSLILTTTYISAINEIGPSVSFIPIGISGAGGVGTVSVTV